MDLKFKECDAAKSLINHSKLSCRSLFKLRLQYCNAPKEENPLSCNAADCVHIAHSATNSLRGSVPIASRTGRIAMPEDLYLFHGAKSPRSLLSALG